MPSAFAIQMSLHPQFAVHPGVLRWNAIRVPSGDHTGDLSTPPEVICVLPDPSGFIVQIELPSSTNEPVFT